MTTPARTTSSRPTQRHTSQRRRTRLALVALGATVPLTMMAAVPASADANGNYLISANGTVKIINRTSGQILKASVRVQCDPNASGTRVDVGAFEGTRESFGFNDHIVCDNTPHTVTVTLYPVHMGTTFRSGTGTAEFNMSGYDAAGDYYHYVINRPVTFKVV